VLRAHGIEQVVDGRTIPDFAAALARLEQLATRRPTAIMCAEAVPWRCHRPLDSARTCAAPQRARPKSASRGNLAPCQTAASTGKR
jgi:uncharacterized protein DUF488